MKYLIYLIVIFFSSACLSQENDECKGVDSPELVRIYYANGMRNNTDDIIENFSELVNLVGKLPDTRDFGFAINKTEGLLLDLYQTFKQKANESPEREYSSDKFWTWTRNLTIAPTWFKKEYKQYLSRFTDAFVRADPDLAIQVRDYIRDLKQGKKVVIVAHSQGNLYANNAYRYIQNHSIYSKYKNSIGIVGIGTVSNQVADQIPYNGRYEYYVLNGADGVVNLLRNFYQVLPPTDTRYTKGDGLNHSFKYSYLAQDGFRSEINTHIFNKTNSLEQPEIAFECKDPSDVPIRIKSRPATEVTDKSAKMHGDIISGKLIDVFFVYRRGGATPPRCTDYDYKYDGKGIWNTGGNFISILAPLTSGLVYSYRACGKREDGTVSEGDPITFVAVFT